MSPTDAPAKITAADFTTSATLAVPMAGLLATDPKLATAELTAEQWHKKLDAYLTSER